MVQFTFHVVGLPHTQTNKAFNWCAYTMKVFNFCKMMHDLGHIVYHYGAVGSNPPCTEHIDIISTHEQSVLFGDYHSKVIPPVIWEPNHPLWAITNIRAALEIKNRQQPNQFLCIIAGRCNQVIEEIVGNNIKVVEYGIGYEGTYAPYRVYESYAHLSHMIGVERKSNEMNPNHVVIPNYYDLADFPYKERDSTEIPYLLYVGRLTKLKGVELAAQVAKEAGVKLLIAGQGIKEPHPTAIIGHEWTIDDGNAEYIGVLDVATRAVVMRKAQALLVPSQYHEPFGGVAVEAQLLGTPVISSDWGAFPETVLNDFSGYRCRTIKQYVEAINKVQNLKRHVIKDVAIERYTLGPIAKKYQQYFEMIGNI